MQKPIREQKAVLVILLSNIFIAFLGIGLIIPVMPLFMNVMHLTGSTMGYLVAAFAVAQLIASPIAGRWVDRYGRKIMIVSGLFLFALSELVFGLGTHVYVLYVARLLGGISAAFIMPAVTAYVADITTVQEKDQRRWVMSLRPLVPVLSLARELAGLLQNTAYACHSSLRQGLRLLPLFRLCLC
ncbi:MFS family permease [Bacillus sp. TBS-096]|nr:MFS family permease [Bacillus sp. TBS-096]